MICSNGMRTALRLLICAACAFAVLDQAAADEPGAWTQLFSAPKGQLGARGYCKPVMLPDDRVLIWGTPGKDVAGDWTTGAFDLAESEWKPLVPAGREAWLKARPKMRYGMRWGVATWMQEGVNQPVPVCHFNQAAYVPTLKKVLYFVGGQTLLLDPATATWEKLEPKTSPPMVLWGALEYDPVHDEVVLFGGGAQNEQARPGTWLYSVSKGDWRRIDQPLDAQPPPRCNTPLAYDATNRLIVVFGGDAQDRYLSDTWAYDCATRLWRELRTNVRPFPRTLPVLCFLKKHGVFMMAGGIPGVPWPPGFSHRPRGKFGGEVWLLDAAKARWTRIGDGYPGGFWASAVYDAKRDRVILHRATSRWHDHAQLQFYAWTPTLEAAGEGVTHDGTPVYRYHPPEWFTEGTGVGPKLPPLDPTAGETFIAALKPNVFTPVPIARNAYARTWGSITYDPHKHEVLLWGGGHCGYCGTDVSHFSLKTLRWTTSFPPEFPPAPYAAFYGDESSFLINNRSFKGRPWVQHGRMSYAYDPVTKRVAFTQTISRTPTRGFTYVYDPAKREFADILPQPFIGGWAVSGITVGTPRGIFCYLSPGDHRSKQVGLFRLDVAARKWTNLSAGKATAPSNEKVRMVYDGRRDRLVLVTHRILSRSEWRPAMYAWDFKAAEAGWAPLEMTGEPPARFGRESLYVPKLDRILNLAATDRKQPGQIYECDLAAGNRWRATGIRSPGGVGPGTGLVYDPALDVFVLTASGTQGPCRVWLMRYAPDASRGEDEK